MMIETVNARRAVMVLPFYLRSNSWMGVLQQSDRSGIVNRTRESFARIDGSARVN